jgi:prepilin-type N-terminal cleavage/methylation domain-containing protein/prepilin-type processing-associated H-X9-DG protein
MSGWRPSNPANIPEAILSMRKSAFTLIELLVVIAIIAILTAILFPVFAQAKAAAKKIACMSNCKQIGTSIYLYLGDSDDTLPMANYPGTAGPPFTEFAWMAGAGSAPLVWADLMQPYAKSTKIFKCPTDDSGVPIVAGNPVKGELFSYALNYYFYRKPSGTFFSLTGGSMSEIPSSSSKLFVCESASNQSREIVRPDRAAGFARHSGGANWIYADTHARYHTMPKWWATVPSATWGNPVLAAAEPAPQWFPWIDADEKW